QPIPDLKAILGAIPWVLVGGIAIRAYMPERATLDVDIMVHAQDEWPARQAFTAAGYTLTGDLLIGGFTAQDHHDQDAPPIDVLAGQAPWLRQVLAYPGYDAAGYPVMPRPYLMLLKMEAGRGQDLIDVQRMLRDTPSSERTSTRALIERYAPEMVEDYDALIQLADIEFGPPRAG
ncbi:MAG: nucleotidyl transferase AbiEii/AbiGii toxin family protein, partial [Roseiflexaceae bacterium]